MNCGQQSDHKSTHLTQTRNTNDNYIEFKCNCFFQPTFETNKVLKKYLEKSSEESQTECEPKCSEVSLGLIAFGSLCLFVALIAVNHNCPNDGRYQCKSNYNE